MLSLSALMVMPASVVCCTWWLVLTFYSGVLRKPVCIKHWFTKGCRCGCLNSSVAYHKRRKEVCSQNNSVFKGCHRNISSTRTINLHLTKKKARGAAQRTTPFAIRWLELLPYLHNNPTRNGRALASAIIRWCSGCSRQTYELLILVQPNIARHLLLVEED
jgi:hypothetical protein